MNLTKYDTNKKSNAGAFLHLTAPTGEKIYDVDAEGNRDLTKPVGLHLLGTDSKVYVDSRHKRMNERFTNGVTKVTSESNDEENIQLLADIVVGWENLEESGDKKFSRDNVLKLFSKYPWVREQADNFAGTRANFI